MPDGLTLIPITYKTEDLQRSDGTLHLDVEEGLDELAEYRGHDLPLPGMDGQYEGIRRADRRQIALVGWIKTATADDYRDLVIELRGIFDPKVPGDLVADLENGSTATIRARTLQISWLGERMSNTRGLRIFLISIAPEWTIT